MFTKTTHKAACESGPMTGKARDLRRLDNHLTEPLRKTYHFCEGQKSVVARIGPRVGRRPSERELG